MGVFDDAIREHLELKRHAGADEAELKELEDEAFGQAARPGDPDFPSSTGEQEAVGEEPGESIEAEEPAAEPEPEPSVEPVLEDEPEPPVEPEPETESAELVLPAAEETESAELQVPAADEPDAVEPDPEPAEAESSFSTAEREAIADQPTVFFDQAPAELELGDLELDFDEEIEEVGGSLSEPLPDEEPLVVEEVFEEPAAEEPAAEVAEPPHVTEPEPEPEPEPVAPEEPPVPEPAEALEAEVPAEDAEPATGEDDVLEETPEFLRDNPDDDELWFEQGEPKDFDF